MKKTFLIEAYLYDDPEKNTCPWRVLVDGKPDPRNRVFSDMRDIRATYLMLKAHGFYADYQIVRAKSL